MIPYLEKTKNGYLVTGPASDGEIELKLDELKAKFPNRATIKYEPLPNCPTCKSV